MPSENDNLPKQAVTETAEGISVQKVVPAASGRKFILVNRNFALLWIGRTISVLGDYAFNTTLVLWISVQIAPKQAWAPLAVSGVLLAAALPALLIGLIAGVFVDRWEIRRVMLYINLLNAALIVALIPITLIPTNVLPIFWRLGLIYLLVFLTSAATQFYAPASIVLIGDIVDEADRTRASGLNQMTNSLALIVGPSIATWFFFAVGPQLSILLDAISFLVAFLAIFFIRASYPIRSQKSNQQKNFRYEFWEGISFCFRHRILRTLFITLVLLYVSDGASRTLGVFFISQNLHTSLNNYGFLITTSSVGFAVGILVATSLAHRLGVARMCWISVLFIGMFEVLYARQTNFQAALALALFQGLLYGAFNVSVVPLILHATLPSFRGRVSSILGTFPTASSLLSVALAGWLDSTLLRNFHILLWNINLGPIDTIYTFTGLSILLSGIYAIMNLHNIHLDGENK